MTIYNELDEYKAGITVDLDSNSVYNAVEELLNDKEKLGEYSKNTKKLINDRFLLKNKFKEYIEILNKLRLSNISSEIYPGEGKLKKQMEYANKIESPFVIFYGDEEIKKAEVKLRNLKTGDESSIKIENLVNEIKKLI